MGIKQLYNDNFRKLSNEYEDVSVMFCHDNTLRTTRSISIDILYPFDVHNVLFRVTKRGDWQPLSSGIQRPERNKTREKGVTDSHDVLS